MQPVLTMCVSLETNYNINKVRSANQWICLFLIVVWFLLLVGVKTANRPNLEHISGHMRSKIYTRLDEAPTCGRRPLINLMKHPHAVENKKQHKKAPNHRRSSLIFLHFFDFLSIRINQYCRLFTVRNKSGFSSRYIFNVLDFCIVDGYAC